jgi:hypothetical protein
LRSITPLPLGNALAVALEHRAEIGTVNKQKDRLVAVSPEDNPDTSKVCGVIYRNA